MPRKPPVDRAVRFANEAVQISSRICEIFGIETESETGEAITDLCSVGLQMSVRGTTTTLYQATMKDHEQAALEQIGRTHNKAYPNILWSIRNAVEAHTSRRQRGRQ